MSSSPRSGPGMRRVWRPGVVLALLTLVTLVLAGAIDPLQSGALTMLPALALGAMLLTRPYLGERTIARLRTVRARAASTAAPVVALPRPAAPFARGGRLIAVASAGRGPPLAHANR